MQQMRSSGDGGLGLGVRGQMCQVCQASQVLLVALALLQLRDSTCLQRLRLLVMELSSRAVANRILRQRWHSSKAA